MSAFLRRALVLAAVTAVVAPAVADAEVTRSTVTSPANPTYLLDDAPPATAGPTLELELEATTDGTERDDDEVDFVCTHGKSTVIATDVPVTAAGKASVEVDVGQFPYQACDLRALPSGYRGPEFGAFSGPTVAVSRYTAAAEGYEVPIHDSTRTAVLDYWVQTGHHRAVAHIRSAGGGGLDDVNGVLAESHAPFQYATWSAGAAIFAPGIEVDGRTAYNAAGIPLFDFDGPGGEGMAAPRGTEGVRSTVALDEATGAVTVGESQRILRCAGTDSAEPTAENCATVLDTGVRHERTITLTREHSIADVRDRWVSTDGSAHQLRFGSTAAAVKSPLPLWRFPGDPAFKSYPSGSVVLPQGPGTLLVRDGEKLAEASRAPGALSYAPAPRFFAFLGRADSADEVVELTVPASGAAPVRRVYAVGRDVAEAEALGRAAEDSFDAPRLAISSPSDGTTTTAAASTVGGRATDNIGVVALSVNGRPAAVSADGAFSVPVPLAGGANEIVVTATDGAGLTATARVAVRRVIERCRVPKVKPGSTLRTARRALAKAGCKASKRARKARSRKVRKGRVIGLTRKAGTVLPLRTTVGIRVSLGRR